MTIRVRQLDVVRDGARLLADVDMDLPGGVITGVVGPNGAGKSSLIRAISGEWPCRGTIEIDADSLSELGLQRRARRLAVLPQQSGLDFPFNAREVVAMARMPADTPMMVNHRIVDDVLSRLDLVGLADRLYTSLSGGEQQRVQTARVIAQLWDVPETAHFLLDEPTAPLDLAHQLVLAEVLAELKSRGAAILLVMHDINLAASICDSMMLLAEGRVLDSGPPARVLDAAQLSAAYHVEIEKVERASGVPAIFARGLLARDD